MGRLARKHHEIESVRESILHAAGRAFLRQGFDSVTIHDIAREAGYTATSLYAYYKGKQEIIDAFVAAVSQALVAVFDAEIPPGLTFPERLACLFQRLAEAADRWPEARLLLHEFRRGSPARRRTRGSRASSPDIDAKLVDWLKRNMTRPTDLAGKTPEEVAFVLRSLLLGAFFPGDFAARPGESSRQHFALALQVFLHGIGGKPPGR